MSNTVVFKCVVTDFNEESKVVTAVLPESFEVKYKVISYIPLEKKEYILVAELSKEALTVRAVVEDDPVVVLAGTVTSTKSVPYEDKQLTSVNVVANSYNFQRKEPEGIFYSFLAGKLPLKKGDNVKVIGTLAQRLGEGKDKQQLVFNNIRGTNYGYLGVGKKATAEPQEESTEKEDTSVNW